SSRARMSGHRSRGGSITDGNSGSGDRRASWAITRHSSHEEMWSSTRARSAWGNEPLSHASSSASTESQLGGSGGDPGVVGVIRDGWGSFERPRQERTSRVELSFRGAYRRVHRGGDVLVGPALDIVKDEHLAGLLGERIEGPGEIEGRVVLPAGEIGAAVIGL